MYACGEDTDSNHPHRNKVTLPVSDIRRPSRIKGIGLELAQSFNMAENRKANTVVTLPKLPSPETIAEAEAIPTSPCLGPNNSAVQVIQMGTVGPNPNPAINSPEYLAHSGPAKVVTSNPVIITKQLSEKNNALLVWYRSLSGVINKIPKASQIHIGANNKDSWIDVKEGLIAAMMREA